VGYRPGFSSQGRPWAAPCLPVEKQHQEKTMSIKRIDVGARMSGAVIHGNTVYLAGQVGEGESVTDQCKSALAEVDRLLAAAGSSKSKVLQTLIYLSDISYFAEMNAAWEAWVDPANTPARATSEAKLAAPKYKVEFIVTAAID
jgi:enamine deaminase RidA (YjgF/YER057c/UK114 family)